MDWKDIKVFWEDLLDYSKRVMAYIHRYIHVYIHRYTKTYTYVCENACLPASTDTKLYIYFCKHVYMMHTGQEPAHEDEKESVDFAQQYAASLLPRE